MTTPPPSEHQAGADWREIEHWVFDLDNTLYPAHCNLFQQIDQRMASFIETEIGLDNSAARRLQKDYYARYGTTLSGLMQEHAIPPEQFLSYVHDIDVSVVPANPALADAINALPGQKHIFTNGSVRHAENVLSKIGLSGLFNDIFDIAAADFTPKPHLNTYERFIAACNVAPTRAAMFEDLALNLEAAHSLGMRTVLVCSDADWTADEPANKRPARPGDDHDHVHHVTEDLAHFLNAHPLAAIAA